MSSENMQKNGQTFVLLQLRTGAFILAKVILSTRRCCWKDKLSDSNLKV